MTPCRVSRRTSRVAALLIAGLCAAGRVGGQTVELVHAFQTGGQPRARLVQGSDGFFYGSTSAGGRSDDGTLFRADAAGNFTVLHQFSGLDGQGPSAELLEADGYLYGTTAAGGLHFGGTIFRMDLAGNLEILHDFDFPVDGGGSEAGLIRAQDGFFYGLTVEGGASGNGTIFRFDGSGFFEIVHAFSGIDGSAPRAALFQVADGSFYGTTAGGGEYGGGTVFRLELPDTLTSLHSFSGDSEGADPSAPFIQATDGLLYTTAAAGGNPGHGAIFRMDLAGNITTLRILVGYEAAGPAGPLVEAPDGYFYGTGAITVFRMDHSGNLTVIHSFDPSEYVDVSKGVTLGEDGRLYGTSASGGTGGIGLVYSMDTGGTLSVLHQFVEEVGRQPLAGLIQGPDGFFYGANAFGGVQGLGTIFKMNALGRVAVFHGFAPEDVGTTPAAALCRGSDGFFYGTTGAFGARGTVFRLDGSGSLTALHLYGIGTSPSSLIQASNGRLYGTNPSGGFHFGSVFRVNADGTVGDIYAFTGGSDGTFPEGPLVQATDGNLYGTNVYTIFRITPGGTLTTLHTFTGSEGYQPMGALIQASDGKLYGTNSQGGANGFGTIFRMTLSGSFESLHDFDQTDGSHPYAGLLQASDGNFYGTTYDGGFGNSNGFGTVFRMDPSGALTTIQSFEFGPGAYPQAPLIQASDGHIYGTGTIVFRIILESFAATSLSPSSGASAGGARLQITGAGFSPSSQARLGGVALPTTDESGTLLFGTAPALAPGTLNDLTVEEGGSSSTVSAAFFSDFLDVPASNSFHDAVESVVRNGLAVGCGGGSFCPGATLPRKQVAVLLLRAEHGPAWTPPSCAGIFGDVPCPGPFADWIEALAAEGVTGGCGGGDFCPDADVTRSQMAVFLLKTSHGPAFVPAPCAGRFDDVACPGLFTDWIEEEAREGITAGCLTNPPLFCPTQPVLRGQSAALLARTFHLP